MFGILGLGDKETIVYTEKADCYEEIITNQKLYKKVK
jgi:chemotaxis protein methyltransferase CheR